MKLTRTRPAVFAALLLSGLITLFSTPPTLLAQDEEAQRPTGLLAGVHLQLMFPRGDFEKKVDNAGFGLNIDLGYAFPGLPLAAGIEGGFVMYGSDTYTAPLSTTLPVNVEFTSTNSIIPVHLFLRLQPHVGDFRPYFEGLAGLSVFTTSVSAKNLNTSEEIAGETKHSDVAWGYGGGGGIMYRVWSGTTNESNNGMKQPMEVFIDARLRYIYGGNAKYYTEEAVYKLPDGSIKFDEGKLTSSKTDYVIGQLGVVVRL